MRHVLPPDASWCPGKSISSPVSEMVSLDPAKLELPATYKLMVGGVLPRPIAFVTTLNSNGTVNLAPFSYFNAVSSNPPAIMFAIARKPNGDKKDTLLNVERTGEFVVNSVSEWMAQPMNHCSAEYPYGVSELEKVGLTAVASDIVGPPRVKESPLHMECKVYSSLLVGNGDAGSSTVIIGEVLRFHIHKPAYLNGKIVVDEMKPLSRLGGFAYGTIGDIFELPRPTV